MRAGHKVAGLEGHRALFDNRCPLGGAVANGCSTRRAPPTPQAALSSPSPDAEDPPCPRPPLAYARARADIGRVPNLSTLRLLHFASRHAEGEDRRQRAPTRAPPSISPTEVDPRGWDTALRYRQRCRHRYRTGHLARPRQMAQQLDWPSRKRSSSRSRAGGS